jgi:hypothetical protein
MDTMETLVRSYKEVKHFNRDAQRLAKDGWQVSSSLDHKNRPGIGRIATLGLFSLVRPPKHSMVVTYVRPTPQKRGKRGKESQAIAISSWSTVVCPRCNGEVPTQARFCPNCGLQRFNPPA